MLTIEGKNVRFVILKTKLCRVCVCNVLWEGKVEREKRGTLSIGGKFMLVVRF